jgi:hypothetical protein
MKLMIILLSFNTHYTITKIRNRDHTVSTVLRYLVLPTATGTVQVPDSTVTLPGTTAYCGTHWYWRYLFWSTRELFQYKYVPRSTVFCPMILGECLF